jgi:type IV pilus assembly protein PilQ
MKKFSAYIMAMALMISISFTISCTSSKKIEQDDDFATENDSSTLTSASSTGMDDGELSLDADIVNPPEPVVDPNKDEFADFDTNPTPPSTFAETPTTDANLENELNNLDATPSPTAEYTPEVAPEPTPAPVSDGTMAQIESVKYQSNQNGGSVIIEGDKPLQFTTRLNPTTNQLVVEVQNATVSDRLKRSLNTKDMASSIGSVDSYQKPGSTVARFVVQLRAGASEPLVQPEGNSLLIIGNANAEYIAKQVAATVSQREGFVDLAADGIMGSQTLEDFLAGNIKYYGKKISIETNNLDIKSAIKFIAEESGTNLLMDEGLDGKISLKLRQVPWDQALILILKAKKLGYVRQGNVLRIATLSDLQKEELEAYKLLENRRSNEPLIVKRFFISYANLKDLEVKIKDFISTTASVTDAAPIGSNAVSAGVAVAGTAVGPLVPAPVQRGRVMSDERTGSLIVTDTPNNMSKIEKLIAALDTQPRQIVVESKIISASESFTRSLGVVWGSSGSTRTTNSAKLGINNQVSGAFDSKFTWGNLDLVGNLDAQIALGELQDKIRVLSTQRTTVISGQTAKIESRGLLNVPIVTTNTATNTAIGVSGFTPIAYGLTGDVIPQASNENTISADIRLSQIKIDDVKTGSTTIEGIGGRVVARSGQTVVVQANFQSINTTNESGVPGLKEIPVIGFLFKGKKDQTNKAETMLFSTMHILEPVNGTKKAANDPTSNVE